MPVMFAFQSMFDVDGAGPAENRLKEGPPWNWGHSYWFKTALADVVCAFVWKSKVEAATVETSSKAKMIVT